MTGVALPGALGSVTPAARLSIPYGILAVATAACAGLVVAATVLAGRAALRHRPLDGLGLTE